MILFTPYPNLSFCAHCFSDRDLFDHQIGTLMILQMIPNADGLIPSEWQKSFKAWQHYPQALLHFHHACILEWDRRGLKPLFNQIRTKQDAYDLGVPESALGTWFAPPGWLGWKKLHASHRSMLGVKDRHYRQIWQEPPGLQVIWPAERPNPGEFLVMGRLTALVMQCNKWNFEIYSNGSYGKLGYDQVERKIWSKDTLPVHERYALEFGEAIESANIIRADRVKI